MSFESTAFISHAKEDEAAALRLKAKLAEHGVEAWCFEEDLRIAAHIETKVKEAIDDCDSLLVIVSDHSIDSKWVRWEIGHAVELHRQRGGVPRPVIIPVHDFDPFPERCEIQPLRFGTDDPIGSPIAFHSHRCHRLQDDRLVPLLCRSMKPEVTRVTDPGDEHAALFEGFGKLLEELFTHPGDRPDVEQVRDWLEADLNRPAEQEWPEFLHVMHLGEDVIGYVYFNFSLRSRFAYATFLGVSRPWRTEKRFASLVQSVRQALAECAPDCVAVLFEVDPFDVGDGRDAEAFLRFSEELARVKRFLRKQALLLCDAKGKPVRVPQYSLDEPLGPETEIDHFLMLLPLGAEVDFSFDEELIGTYVSLARAGFGPRGVNIPGYDAYLVGFEARLRTAIPSGNNFQNLYFDSAMRAAVRHANSGGRAAGEGGGRT